MNEIRATRPARWFAAALLWVPLAAFGNGGTAVSPAELSAQLHSGKATIVVDVRTAPEFHGGHIAGALNVPHDAIDQRWRATVHADPDDEVILYCGTGRRASLAQQTLDSMGWYHTRVLTGGVDAWTKAGLPLVIDDARQEPAIAADAERGSH